MSGEAAGSGSAASPERKTKIYCQGLFAAPAASCGLAQVVRLYSVIDMPLVNVR